MKPALQSLLLANDEAMRANTLLGIKKISIREGDRDYREGPMMIVDHIVPFVVQVTVTNVRKCKLSEVTEEEYFADNFKDKDDLLSGMKIYYPNLNWDSIVTILRWENVCGQMVDDFDDQVIELGGGDLEFVD